jgi:hypothetical protein
MIKEHMKEIKTFIFNQKIDILLVSKTHFTNKNYCRAISGYTFYYSMHSDVKFMKELLFL